jgi:histidine ammonia-lyase
VVETQLLTGDDLEVDHVWAVAVEGAPVGLSESARERMRVARDVVERAAASPERTYGVNTGFGRLVTQTIPAELVDELQIRLLRSHACGVGDPYPDEIVRAALVLRATGLATGVSGTRVEVAERLLECLRRGLPRCQAGAPSGPAATAPLAHLAPRQSAGRRFEGEPAGRDALARAGVEPAAEAKRGSLINGTQFMAAWALGVVAKHLAVAADIACSLSSARGSRKVSPVSTVRRCAVRPRPRTSSSCSGSRSWSPTGGAGAGRLFLRCAPQVRRQPHLRYVEETVTVELNAATDNPLVLVDDGMLVSNGNFHGEPVAFALDAMAMAVAELASISERRTERMVNPALSDGLPAFLTVDGGLNSGFMIPQYVAAALVSENKVLAHPASVDSIPTSAGQEDHVSMGNAAALTGWQVLANGERVLAIELLAGAQAVEFHAPLQPGPGVAAVRRAVRTLSERLVEDRSLSRDIEAVAAAIRDGSLAAAVEVEIGALP